MVLRQIISLLAALLLTQGLWGVKFADADEIYTYTGDEFTSAVSPYTTTDSVTATIVLQSALGDDVPLSFVSPTDIVSFTISDGVFTYTNLNVTSASFSFATGDTGDIISWAFNATELVGGSETAYVQSQDFSFGGQDFTEINGNPTPTAFVGVAGTWGVAGPIAGAGLPGLMFAGGGMLAWWRRKRNAVAAAA